MQSDKFFPAFVISLDFELLWGIFDKVDFENKKTYFNNTRNVIPEILKLFQENKVHTTWATVGMLFNSSWEEWMTNSPINKPNYNNSNLNPYHYGEKNKFEIDDNLCFASEIIDLINQTEGQEIGTHTYSHYYCLEPGQTIDSFQADLEINISIAKKRKIDIKSLVFPRNQFNLKYLKTCKELGITSVRSNPLNWYWQNTQKDSLQQKIFRTGDAYFGFNDKSYKISKINPSLPVLQPASRLLRPYTGNLLDKIKLNRIKNEMIEAAQNNKIYHLWWHPHNFGNNPRACIGELKYILDHFKECEKKYGMRSLNMFELSEAVLNR